MRIPVEMSRVVYFQLSKWLKSKSIEIIKSQECFSSPKKTMNANFSDVLNLKKIGLSMVKLIYILIFREKTGKGALCNMPQ